MRRRKKKKKGASKQQCMFEERAGWFNQHHIVAKERGGPDTFWNKIQLDARRHAAFHLLFGNMTFAEAAGLLARASQLKDRLAV